MCNLLEHSIHDGLVFELLHNESSTALSNRLCLHGIVDQFDDPLCKFLGCVGEMEVFSVLSWNALHPNSR